ncbi:MAG: hypothetical protein R3Y63_06520 [Eubacteriales bacterium]
MNEEEKKNNKVPHHSFQEYSEIQAKHDPFSGAEDYDPYDHPYQEHCRVMVEKKNYVGYGLSYAKDYYEANLTEEDRYIIKRNTIIAITYLIFLLIYTFFQMPPIKREFVGELGTYTYYHYQGEIRTPSGQKIQYQRAQYGYEAYYTFTIPGEMEDFTISSVTPDRRTYGVLRTTALQAGDADLYNGLLAVEDFAKGDVSMEKIGLFLVILPYYLFGLFFIFFPYHVAEYAGFFYVTWGLYARQDKFIIQCRIAGTLFFLFMCTPWGQAIGFRIFLFFFQLVFGGWMSAMGGF